MGKGEMGIKLFKLQTIQWCFMVGNSIIQAEDEDHHTNNNRTLVKLIKTDGVVNIYDRPVPVSDLMLEFPKHMVCPSDSFYIGQKIPALSKHDQLLPGHNYFLLPIHCFQSALSLVTVATSFANSFRPQQPAATPNENYNVHSSNKENIRVALLKNPALNCRPFDIQKTTSGFLRIRITDEFISRLMIEDHREDAKIEDNQHQEQGVHSSSSKSKSKSKSNIIKSVPNGVIASYAGSALCTTPELEKDYGQLVGMRRHHWKPRLETIREATARRHHHDHDDQNNSNKKKMSKIRKLSSFGGKSSKKNSSKEI